MNEISTYKIKEIGKEEVIKDATITDEVISEITSVDIIENNTGYKIINIREDIKLEGYKQYYQIGKNGSWQEGKGSISILDYDVATNGLLNNDNTVTITTKLQNDTNNYIVSNSIDIQIDPNSRMDSFDADSIIQAIEKYNFGTGLFKVGVNGEKYNLRVFALNGDQTFNEDMTLGTEADVATADEDAKNMIVLKVNGDLTISGGKTLTAYASKDGYGGPKGMMVYCTGTLTNNGTISMTARGARAEGQNVYLWKNANGTYEFVPKDGAAGAKTTDPEDININNRRGYKGANGVNRQTGGGGSGTDWFALWYGEVFGAGANGTSYSGGSGGGGSDGGKAEDAHENGGAGRTWK